MVYYNLDTQKRSADINLLFPNWQNENECLVVYSPHDDDALLGAAYAIRAAIENGASVNIFIFCNGCAGYSDISLKDRIISIRESETLRAYRAIGIPSENIVYFDIPDFSANTMLGWKLGHGVGAFEMCIKELRSLRATRVLVPNAYREHLDHEAVYNMGAYDAPQAGDAILADWGKPTGIKSVLCYSVWSDFSPEDAMVKGRSTALRANCGIECSDETEAMVRKGIFEYRTQAKIIDSMVQDRENRRTDAGYAEMYVAFDPRPKMNYAPYIKMMNEWK